MLINYYLILAHGSSMDEETHNTSFFNTIEQVRVAEEVLGSAIRAEVHTGWLIDPCLHHKDVETRLVVAGFDTKEDSFGYACQEDASRVSIATESKMWIREKGFILPSHYGTYLLMPEWRVVGDEKWMRDQAVWPLTVRPLQKDEEEPTDEE